ncbi:MAG: spore maturation protein [Proteobacteria bacterium]|nr:spore maturation protein [Pseudomonadota bacterium]
MNSIWIILISVSIVVAACTGRLDALTRAMFDGAKAAVEISLFLLGIVSLWLGITKIIEDSGLIHRIAHIFKPVVTRLFKTVPPDHPAITSITLNMLANFFGLGNAATPLGIKAMQDLQSLNSEKDSITFEMMLFIVLNTASVQLIPFTVVGILSDFGSANPSGIVLPTICSTVISAFVALGVLWLFRRFRK